MISETVNLGDKDITVNELNFFDARPVNLEVLLSVEKILNEYQDWNKSTYELSIEKPKLFLKLLSLSTGESKKFLRLLTGTDYDQLMFVFLSVNAEFFIQRLKLIQLPNAK